MGTRRTWLVGGFVAAAAIALAGVGVVMAQSTGDGSGTFLDRVAQKLGIEPERLEQAVIDTKKEDVDAATERGDITREQADRLKERIDSGDGFGPGPFLHPGGIPFDGKPFGGRHGHHRPPGGPGFGFGFEMDFRKHLDDLASFLGMSADELRAELSADNATLATVAAGHGKSRDELKTFLSAQLDEKLDQAVADGDIDQNVADEIKAKTSEMLDGVIDRPHGSGGPGHFRFEWQFKDNGDQGAVPQLGGRSGVERS